MLPTRDELPSEAETSEDRRFIRSAVRRFALWSVLVLLVLTGACILIGGRIAQESALQAAQMHGVTVANSVAAPHVDEAVRAGDPAALQRLGQVMQPQLDNGSLTHVKLWSRDGRVLWSDEKALVGRTFSLSPEVDELFRTQKATAELSDLTKAENVEDRSHGELLEVYVGTVDANSNALVFEAYLSTERMRNDQQRTVLDILPVAVGGLLLFQLTVLPLALSLARRVQHGEAERVRIMRQAQLLSAQESRRIALDLHDGVIQDLAGLSYAMPAVMAQLPTTEEAAGAREAVRRSTEILRRDVASLRSMMVDIYPPDLHGSGFAPAVEDLAHQVRAQGLDVEVRVREGYNEPLDASRLAYRLVREGLRNVVKHARASRASVSVDRKGRLVHVEVRDNGVGISDRWDAGKGHLGLVLLRDTLHDFGGGLSVRAIPGGGTVLEAVFPADLLEGARTTARRPRGVFARWRSARQDRREDR
ncbi:MAG: two-component sensor histidine kinase [Marmoricola sp.]|nr:two-component sensor histidine kinase [Marmoricola sp.]